tara:strand:+ start:7579 stop:8079 length:501 start_codon:yes stop_codon:yes gene_type:complete
MMTDPYMWLAGVIGFIILVWVAKQFLFAPRYPYISKPILTNAELNFYKTLSALVHEPVLISFKPRLGDIVDVEEYIRQSDPDWIGRYGAPVWSKHIDFVLINGHTADVLCCIELDDRSHLKRENAKRDQFKNKALEAADIPLIRIRCQRTYKKEAVLEKIAPYLNI